MGYGSKGVVYLAIGVLSAQAAIGLRRRAANQAAVFEAVLEQTFGVFLLVALSLGLVGYALWRLGQALLDP